jgi:hypothetical protein
MRIRGQHAYLIHPATFRKGSHGVGLGLSESNARSNAGLSVPGIRPTELRYLFSSQYGECTTPARFRKECTVAYSTYHVNQDKTDVLTTLLKGTPQEFNPDNATLRGRYVTPGIGPHAAKLAVAGHAYVKYGELPKAWYPAINWATYVIYSYKTPIAWFDPDNGWTMPADNELPYSNTTRKHQYKVRRAIMSIIRDHCGLSTRDTP